MEKTIDMRKMYDEIMALKKEVALMKSQRVDIDAIMTPEEEVRYEESMKEYNEGKAISFEDLKKELGD